MAVKYATALTALAIAYREGKVYGLQSVSFFANPHAVCRRIVNKRKVKFLADYVTACNSLCMLFACHLCGYFLKIQLQT